MSAPGNTEMSDLSIRGAYKLFIFVPLKAIIPKSCSQIELGEISKRKVIVLNTTILSKDKKAEAESNTHGTSDDKHN